MARVGPGQNLEQLFAGNHARLVLLLTVAAGDRGAAEDAVQEAFAQALMHWDRIGSYDDPLVWVRRVATNRILNQHRSRRRGSVALGRLASRPDPATTRPAFDVASDERAVLLDALRRLPLRQRTAMALYYLADLSTEDVAGAMDITPGAVRFHLHAARQALGPLLEAR